VTRQVEKVNGKPVLESQYRKTRRKKDCGAAKFMLLKNP